MEHLQHFGLTRDPFSNEPDLRFYFESGSHHDAQRRAERGIRQHKGLTVLTGDGGMGKTLLSRRILDSLEEEVFESTLLMMLPGAADATSVLQRFVRQIGADEPASDRAALLGQIYEQLSIVREDGRHAVLIIDDAQILAPDVLSELGGLLSLEYEDKRLLSMLLVGSPDLDQLVENDPGMKPRLDVRVRLQPFDLVNTQAYVKHRLVSVQAQEGLVSPEATESLQKFGGGRPRLINTLADNALFETYLGGRLAIEPMDVERAAGDLGIGCDPGTSFSPQQRAVLPPPAAENAVSESLASAEALPALEAPDLLSSADPDEAPVAAPMASVVAPPPAFSLDQDELVEPVAQLDLTSEVPVVEDTPVSPTLDLGEGFEASLTDFEAPPQETSAPSPDAGAPQAAPDFSEFEFESEPQADRALPPIADALAAPLDSVAQAAPQAVPDRQALETGLDPLSSLPPAMDLIAESEALDLGGDEPNSSLDVVAPAKGPSVDDSIGGLDGLDFDLEPVTTLPDTQLGAPEKPVFEMDFGTPVEQGEDLSLETDLGVLEAAELTPLELESAEEFDESLMVELVEE